MPEQFLYQRLDAASELGLLPKDIPDCITQNLNSAFELREYQTDAFARFIHCYNNDFPGKEQPLHLLFNMATGSGKTLIMAGLILYLYEKGHRNFLFFVNSTNIIEKTKDNFLNPITTKYLFSEDIHINGKRVAVTQVNEFNSVNENDINICFTTIQKLHTDMTTEKENTLTYENFAEHEIVLLADEAHHLNVSTRTQQALANFVSWENTVQKIFKSNDKNLLLEFTATHDYATNEIVTEYQNKVINRYDLKDFRNDKFSKEIELVYFDMDLPERMLQALILSQYKLQVALKYKKQLKPVILFKEKTISRSNASRNLFRRLLEDLDEDDINNIRRSDVPAVQRAFSFFDENNTSSIMLKEQLKDAFAEDFCLSVNNQEQRENYQIQINTLEDRDNPIRAIFAVQQLNEGWDVLNLFDIVRCYETRDSGNMTISEAQLIGRGARYCPLDIQDYPDKYRRKFDDDLDHELRILEELHYHSMQDSRYLSEIRLALIDEGMLDSQREPREIKLKDEFKDTDHYKKGTIWINKQVKKSYRHIHSFSDLGVTKKDYQHHIATGEGGQITALENQNVPVVTEENPQSLHVKDIDKNIIKTAIACNPFYTFKSLKRYFPQITSISEFVNSEDYLGGLTINLQGNISDLDITRKIKFNACRGLLTQIESDIKDNITEHEGTTDFQEEFINAIFTDKRLEFSPETLRNREDPQTTNLVSSRHWFVYDNLFGTTEERACVRMLDRWINDNGSNYEAIYLIRNEGHFSLYNFSDGKGFQPDFVLFLRENNGESLTYQLFIEPKGEHIAEGDQWKVEFLQQICAEYPSRTFTEDNNYRVIGVPSFYYENQENEFRNDLNNALQKNS